MPSAPFFNREGSALNLDLARNLPLLDANGHICRPLDLRI
jgi:hypothetical protein